MKTIIVNLDGSAFQFSKTQYIKYLRDRLKDKCPALNVYNAKYLGGIRYTEDLQNELDIMTERTK